MYDSVGFVNAVFRLFSVKTAQESPVVRIAVSRAPYFGVHLDP
jgi:hypothetical protein